jgi:tetratricopeptide (TPR) repeat protein
MALTSDLHWQIDQFRVRGVKDKAGNPYNPSYYKRGLKNAVDEGGIAVADYVRRYLYKPPSEGYKKLEEADALDLVCEALVADASKPYASHLFTDPDRAAAQARLAPYIASIAARKAAIQERIAARQAKLSGKDIADLRLLAADATDPEDAVAVNSAILEHVPDDLVALNRLGRAHETLGSVEAATQAFQRAVAADPDDAIAARRLRDITRRTLRGIRA